MKRLLLGALAVCTLAVAVALSNNQATNFDGTLRVAQEDKNPWNNLRLNNEPGTFQFAIVSDRTGGHRAKIFSRAVEQLNLMQPEFVLSVGDLIEGYTEKGELLEAQWLEFDRYVNRLQMPFFYVPGNHDVTNAFQEKYWQERYGRRYFHFVYKNCLFLFLNSEDPPGKGGAIGAEQIETAKKALDENPGVRWTFVFLHKPLWAQKSVETNGWLGVEQALGERPYTVFCGHVHRYQKYSRNGRDYYQLATTGGGSKVRGVRYGEFDHIMWVTMRGEQPVLANVLLNGVFDSDLKQADTQEEGVPVRNRKPTHPVRGRLTVNGKPAEGVTLVFHTVDAKGKATRVADALTESDGTFIFTTYVAFDGAPVGEYTVTAYWPGKATEPGKPAPNRLKESFGKPDTSGLKFSVAEGSNNFDLDLKN